MAKNEKVTTVFSADIRDLKSKIQEANRNIKLANAEFKAAASSMDFMADSAEGIEKKLEQLNKVYKAQNTILDAYKDELAKIVEEQGEESAAADNMRIKIANQQAAVNKTAAELATYEKKLDGTEGELEDVTKATDEMTEETKDASEGFTVMKGVLADLASKAISAVISGLKDLGKAAMDAWKEFDEGVDIIVKKTGLTGEAAKEMEESFANVSKTILADNSDIANAMGELNTRFGYTGKELEDATVAFLKFADVTGADAADAVADVAKALTASGKSLDNYQEILDALTVAGQKSGVSVTKVADGLTKYGAQTRALGLDIDEVIALFAQFELAGVNTEAALAGLTKATGNWQKAGLDAGTELTKTIEAIRTAGDSSKAAEIAIAAFGNKAGPELADAIQSGRFAFDEFTKAVKDSGGAVDRTFEETQDAPDKLALAVKSLKTDVAQTTNELLTEFAPDIEKALEKISEVLKKDVIPAIKSAISWLVDHKSTVLAVLKAIGVGLLALNVAKMIKTVVAAFQLFNAVLAANPIGLIITAIGLLVAAFITLWNKSEAFRNFFIGMWEAIKETVGAILDGIVSFFSAAWDGIKSVWDTVSGYFAAIWEGIKFVFSVVADYFKMIFQTAWNYIKFVWDTVVNYFKLIWEGIKTVFEVVKKVLSGDFEGAWDAIKGLWDKVVGFFEGIWEGIKGVFAPVGDFFKKVFEGAKDTIKNIWDSVSEIVKAPINFLMSGLNSFIRTLNKIEIPDWVPGVGGKGINLPLIPTLARGGILKAGQIGLLEGNGAEAVVPLENNKAWISAVASALRGALQSEGVLAAAGGGAIVNNYNFNQVNNSPKALDRLQIYRDTQNLINLTKGANG